MNLTNLKGKSNPYNILWYCSIELGRGYLIVGKRVGLYNDSNELSSVNSLLDLYIETYNMLESMSKEEREFLYQDSYYCKCDFYGKTNIDLLEMSKLSGSNRSFSVSLDSLEYLKATWGNEEGTTEFNRRCRLVELGKSTSISVLNALVNCMFDAYEKKVPVSEIIYKYPNKVREFYNKNEDIIKEYLDVDLMIMANKDERGLVSGVYKTIGG